MGQQQLLLLILAAVIVGVTILLGINLFSQNAAEANQAAVLQDILNIAGRAQAWYKRPAQMGGGGRTFAGISLAAINLPAANANGSYLLSGASGTAVTITGTGVEDGNGDGSPLQVVVSVGVDTVGAATITP
jgi:hypothetical protein